MGRRSRPSVLALSGAISRHSMSAWQQLCARQAANNDYFTVLPLLAPPPGMRALHRPRTTRSARHIVGQRWDHGVKGFYVVPVPKHHHSTASK